jgi:ABC-type glycerol-3-phosphate transport system substrate-binding protein
MDWPPSGRLTRRHLLGVTAVAAGGLAGCQTSDTDETVRETVTPAAVPTETFTSRLELRHDTPLASPTAAAIEQLLTAFEEATQAVTPVEQTRSGRETEDRGGDGTAIVTYDRIGATLAPRTEELRSLDALWESQQSVLPHGVAISSYVGRAPTVIPQAVNLLNCLYYNPEVLSDAGISPGDYATVRDVYAEPGPLAETVETLFAQPLRSATDLLELWEGLLGSRLYRQRQYMGYVSGHVDNEPLPIKRATRDLDAALSMLPTSAGEATPESLLDGVVDGSIGFVRQPTWASQYLRDRSDVTYGTDWAVAPLFGSPWGVVFVAEGFAVPDVSEAVTSRALIQFATDRDQQRHFCATAGAIPARTDVTVDAHPMLAEQTEEYREASMHLPSMAHGVAVRTPVRRSIEAALTEFRDHRDVEQAVEDLIAALRTAEMV